MPDISKLTVGVNVTECYKCHKLNMAIDIMNQFNWTNTGALDFDKDSQEIILVEEQVMRIVQMVNPAQQIRKIRLISQDEYLKRVHSL